MSATDTEPNTPSLSPAALRPELSARFLAAMQAVSEEGGDELEQCLHRLKPAPVGVVRHQTWLAGVQSVAVGKPCRSDWSRFGRWGAAAALFILCTSGSLFMVNSRASATVVSGLACRSLVESRTGNVVHWHEGQTALRTCEVLYEDSFVLDGDEESTITVRVPVRSHVMIEEEVI